MNKQNFLTRMLLLFALIVGSVNGAWADEEVVYTLETQKNGSNTAYASYYDVTINDLTWNAPGNQNTDGCWRIGGKSISEVERVITGKNSIDSEITKITFNHKGKSRANVSVPSVKLTVASDAEFNTIIDEVTISSPSITKGETASFNFTPTSPLTKWNSGCYYKFTIVVSNSDSSNGGLDLTSIVFYKTVADKTVTVTAIDNAGISNTDLKNGPTAGSLSANVTAGGSAVAGATVTWESDNTNVATIDDSGNVTLVGVGTATITATYAGDATYANSSDTYDLTVKDTRAVTVTTIDATGLTNIDVYTSTVAGQLTASVKAGGSDVDGATVTWTSSNPEVATVDDSGNVTLVKAGTTTITASYAGAAAYSASFDTYDLIVIDSNAPLLYESVSEYISDNDSSTKINKDNYTNYLDSDNWDVATFDNVYPGKNGCFKFGASSKTGTAKTTAITLTGCAKLTFQVKRYKDGEAGPMNITVEGATATGDVSVTGTADFVEHTVYLNNATGSITITFATESKRMYLDEVKLVRVEKDPVTVTSAGYATFASDYNLDYTGLDVKAYKALVSEKAISFTKVTTVPAGEGVLLQGAEGTYNVPVAASAVAAWADSDNAFVRGSDAEVVFDNGNGTYNYVLSTDDKNVVGFYKAAGKKVAKNHAYLQSTTNAARLAFNFDDETGEATGISEMKNVKDDAAIYNLNGVRVKNMTKGLYIMNGKKVIVK